MANVMCEVAMFLRHGFSHNYHSRFTRFQEPFLVSCEDGCILFGVDAAIKELEIWLAGKAELGDTVVVIVEHVSPECQDGVIRIGRSAEARPVDSGEIATAKNAGPCGTDEGATQWDMCVFVVISELVRGEGRVPRDEDNERVRHSLGL